MLENEKTNCKIEKNNRVIECANCGCIRKLMIELNDNFYCEECLLYLKGLVYCRECNKIVDADCATQIEYLRYYICNDCLKLNHRLYCNCMQCNNWFRYDYIKLHFNEIVLCQDCANSIVIRTLRESTFKDNWRFHKIETEKEKLYLGIELEIDFCEDELAVLALYNLAKLFYFSLKPSFCCKRDGSIEYGFEIVTHPMTLNFHRNMFNWNEILNILEDADALIHDNCGLHIHVNKNCFTTIEQIKLGLFTYRYTEKLEDLGGRKLNTYCQKNDKKLKEMGSSIDRYEIVNFTNENTIEFRFPKATIDFSELMARIELIHAICMYCKETGIGIVANGNWNQFVEFIERNCNKYTHLHRIYIKQ